MRKEKGGEHRGRVMRKEEEEEEEEEKRDNFIKFSGCTSSSFIFSTEAVVCISVKVRGEVVMSEGTAGGGERGNILRPTYLTELLLQAVSFLLCCYQSLGQLPLHTLLQTLTAETHRQRDRQNGH